MLEYSNKKRNSKNYLAVLFFLVALSLFLIGKYLLRGFLRKHNRQISYLLQLPGSRLWYSMVTQSPTIIFLQISQAFRYMVFQNIILSLPYQFIKSEIENKISLRVHSIYHFLYDRIKSDIRVHTVCRTCTYFIKCSLKIFCKTCLPCLPTGRRQAGLRVT